MKILRKRMKPPAGRDAGVQARLPLRPVAFAVLAALAEGPRAGIEILDQVNATVPGRPLLGPGTLYRLMRELRAEGVIARTDTAGAGDDRHSYHVLTPLGAAVLKAEVERLRRTIHLAEATPPGRSR
jgi:DNA-binding PadR family transcriptional regulator